VKKLATVKKAKVPKIIPPKIEKPLVVQWQNFSTPAILENKSISPLQGSASAGILILFTFSGIYILIKRKKVIL
jgi:hypothetical protein